MDPEDTIRFLHQFDIDFGFRSVEYGMTLWVEDSDCRDVNRIMCEIVAPLKAALDEELSKESTKKDLEKARLSSRSTACDCQPSLSRSSCSTSDHFGEERQEGGATTWQEY